MKTIEQIESELDQDIPRDVISQREGGKGKTLSYLKTWYVIDRLNEVFGPLNWAKEILDIKEVINVVVKRDWKTKEIIGKESYPAYIVKVRLSIIKPDHTVVIKEAYGYGSDKSDLNAHELAIKEGVSDALKVAAKDFGMSLGLALYDKTQERVSDDVEQKSVAISPKPSASGHTVAAIQAVLPAQPKSEPKAHSKEDLSKAIKSYFSVVEAQKRLTKDVFRSDYLGKYSASKVDDLNVEQSEEVLARLKTLSETK